MSKIKIALDAGHGLYTKGKQTPDGIKEWSINDKVRDKVVEFLKDYNVEIIHLDNDEGKTDESLASRVSKYINASVSAVVSIHHNAYKGIWGTATGVEVFTDKNPTEADKRLAECIYSRLVKYTNLKGRGIKKEAWYVINQNKIPAVLCEGGFMDGTEDYKIITSDEGQTAYAKAVAEGIVEFLGLKKKTVKNTNDTNTKPSKDKVSVVYQTYDNKVKCWLPNVTDTTDYAGILGDTVGGIYANLSKGNIIYKVHTKNGKWLPEVTNRTDYAGIKGKAIDGVMIKSTNADITIHYQVHICGGKWLPYVTGYNSADGNNGYAGIIGKSIDAIRIYATKN